jgi:transaldolase
VERRGKNRAALLIETAFAYIYFKRENQETNMKFFLDTANLDEIRQAAALGLCDGVTTNPTLVAKEGNVDFKQHIAEICKIVSGPVSAEVTTDKRDEMLKQGREYVKIAPNVVIKCPLTQDGLEATRILNEEGIKVNVTLCFSAAQAVCAAKAGASFISPFLGRLDDIGDNGLRLLEEIIEIYDQYDWKTEVLAASLRHPIHIIEAARMGADIATMPFKVFQQLLKHPLTDKGQDQFLADWKKTAAAKA